MKSKGFSDQWTQWVMKVVCGGRVVVNLDGELGQYFRSYKGLRQGDPLSPILLNLVADGLSAILNKAAERGVISGVTPQLVPAGLTHLQYENQRITLLISNSYFFCFEEVSGMKINYHKSEVLTIGI